MLKFGQQVKQEFGSQVIQVIGFDPDFLENVIAQWEDETGTVLKAKFMEAQLKSVYTIK